MLCGCCCPIRVLVCPLDVGVEALRFGLNQAPFPLSVCSAQKEGFSAASESYMLKEE